MHAPQRTQPVRSGPSPPKYGSGTVLPGSPMYTATCGCSNASGVPRSRADLAEQRVGGRAVKFVGARRASARGRVVRRELLLPVGQPGHAGSRKKSSFGIGSVLAYVSEPPPTPAPAST